MISVKKEHNESALKYLIPFVFVTILLLRGTLLMGQEYKVIDQKGTFRSITNNIVTVSATEPTTPVESDIWFDTANNLTKVWDGSAWQNIQADTAFSLWDKNTNTGIQVEESADEDKIRFDTAGTERLIIDETGQLLFANPGDFNTGGTQVSAVLGIDGTTHGRLRLTAGSQDTFSDTEGASIDLHANSATSNTGVLDLVAGQAASGTAAAIKFWTNTDGSTQQTSAVITGAGNMGIGNTAPNANAILDLTNSDDKAFLLPTETLPTNIGSPTDGMLVYSSSNQNAYLRANSAWKPVTHNLVTNELIFDGEDDADISNDDFYYVSMLINGNWKVIRYNKTDVNDEKEATVSNNPGQTTQPIDLPTCTGLIFN